CVRTHTQPLTQPFERPEIEGTILVNRTAEGSPEEIVSRRSLFGSLGVKEKIVSIQDTIAKEIERTAVNLIGSALGTHIDHRAREAAKLGRVELCLDLKFRDRIDGYQCDTTARLT